MSNIVNLFYKFNRLDRHIKRSYSAGGLLLALGFILYSSSVTLDPQKDANHRNLGIGLNLSSLAAALIGCKVIFDCKGDVVEAAKLNAKIYQLQEELDAQEHFNTQLEANTVEDPRLVELQSSLSEANYQTAKLQQQVNEFQSENAIQKKTIDNFMLAMGQKHKVITHNGDHKYTETIPFTLEESAGTAEFSAATGLARPSDFRQYRAKKALKEKQDSDASESKSTESMDLNLEDLDLSAFGSDATGVTAPTNVQSSKVVDMSQYQTKKLPDNAWEVAESLSYNNLSMFFTGGTRCGKTTLVRAVMLKTLERRPDTQFFFSAEKINDWFGYEKSPHHFHLMGVERDLTPLNDAVTKVMQIFKYRKEKYSEDEVKELDLPEVVLVLDDYTSQAALIKKPKSNQKEWAASIKGAFTSILFNGAAHRIKLWFTLHALSMELLDFFPDASSRATYTYVVVARKTIGADGVTPENGYDPMHVLLKNRYLFPSVDPNKLKEKIEQKIIERDSGGSFQVDPLVLIVRGGTPSLRNLGVLDVPKLQLLDVEAETVKEPESGEDDLQVELPILSDPKQVEVTSPSMVNLKPQQLLDISEWDRIHLETPEHLQKLPPFQPGIYVVIIDNYVMYVGESNNLYQRWNTSMRNHKHKRLPAVLKAIKEGRDVYMAYFQTQDPQDKPGREKLESTLVSQYRPLWNGNTESPLPE